MAVVGDVVVSGGSGGGPAARDAVLRRARGDGAVGAVFPLTGGRRPPNRRSTGGFAVCATCCGPARSGCTECWSCLVVRLRLGRGALPWPIPVTPLCVTAASSGIHAALVAYKAAPTSEVRQAAAASLGDLLGGWLAGHARCVIGAVARQQSGAGPGQLTLDAGGAPPLQEGVTLVPVPSSTGGRPSWGDGHPLEWLCRAAVEAGAPGLGVRSWLRAGQHPPQRLQPATDGFEMRGGHAEQASVAGRPVLVVDDLLASGSRAFSAAASLAAAGADVRGIVVLGRFVHPSHNTAAAAYWRAAPPVEAAQLIATCRWCAGRTAARACSGRRKVVLRLAA